MHRTIYVKTQKGIDEMLARKASLNAMLSSILLLIDGKHSQLQLIDMIAKLNAPADSLEVLERGGYIEGHRFADSAPTTRPLPEPFESSRKPGVTQAESKAYLSAYAYMVAETKKRLGLRGYVMQLKIERAQTISDLRSLIDPLTEAVAKSQGYHAAQEFTQHCHSLMDDKEIRAASLRLVEDAQALRNSQQVRLRRVA